MPDCPSSRASRVDARWNSTRPAWAPLPNVVDGVAALASYWSFRRLTERRNRDDEDSNTPRWSTLRATPRRGGGVSGPSGLWVPIPMIPAETVAAVQSRWRRHRLGVRLGRDARALELSRHLARELIVSLATWRSRHRRRWHHHRGALDREAGGLPRSSAVFAAAGLAYPPYPPALGIVDPLVTGQRLPPPGRGPPALRSSDDLGSPRRRTTRATHRTGGAGRLPRPQFRHRPGRLRSRCRRRSVGCERGPPGQPRCGRVKARALANISGVMSTPMTHPVGPTSLPAMSASVPDPEPQSTTRSPATILPRANGSRAGHRGDGATRQALDPVLR